MSAATFSRPGGRLSWLSSDRFWGWAGPVLLALVAALVRWVHLDRPGVLVFDEVYYAPEGLSYLEHGVEYKDGAPEFVVHPPVGKWVIAAGEWVLGDTPAGWRLGMLVVGALSVLVLARVARRLFRSTLLGCVAGLLLAFDGLHYVHSRVALLDLVLMFFALAGFGALLVDRDRVRARQGPSKLPQPLGWRPWRLAAGVLLGLACGTKWSGLYFLAAFSLLSLGWDGALRWHLRRGVERVLLVVRDSAAAFVSLVPVALVAYVASWTGWFAADASRAWGRVADVPGPPLVPDALWALWRYHVQAYRFHVDLDDTHPYEAGPEGWLLLTRPTAMFYDDPGGCGADLCSQAVVALGSPVIWWVALPALLVLGGLVLRYRDWVAGAVLTGVAAGWLPWFLFPDRTTFSFYAVAFLPWVVLAVTLLLGRVLAASSRPGVWSVVGRVTVGLYLLLVVGIFFYFYPVLSGELVPYEVWRSRMWSDSWI